MRVRKKKYQTEYDLMSQIAHPNVIRYYAFYVSDAGSTANLVMELAPSGSVRYGFCAARENRDHHIHHHTDLTMMTMQRFDLRDWLQ